MLSSVEASFAEAVMGWGATWWARLRHLRGRTAAERDMNEEMRFHLDSEIADEIARGTDPEEARRVAHVRFGGVERYKEEARDARRVRPLIDLAFDIRYGVRVLRRNPAFAAAAILTLALGIGAATTIFGVVRGVLLRPLPYADPQRLAVVWERNRSRGLDQNVVSAGTFDEWRKRSTSFTDLAAVVPAPLTYRTESGSERLPGVEVSPAYFRILGIAPQRGRLLVDEDATSRREVVVVSDRFWRERLGGEPVIGRTLTLGGREREIVGVLPAEFDPPRFSWLNEQQLFLPFTVTEENTSWGRFLIVIGRLRPAATVESAHSEMERLADVLAAERAENDGWSAHVITLTEQITGPVRVQLRALLAAVALLLVMAIVNVANLLLAHARSREREIAVRMALGASWRRIGRQLLAQGAVIAIGGGALGILFAYWGTRTVIALLPPGMPRVGAIRMDFVVLVASLAAVVVAAIVIGALPAMRGQAQGASPTGSAHAGARVTGRLDGGGLLIAEIALAMILCATAGLMMRSFVALRSTSLGFEASGVAVARVALPEGRYADRSSVAAFQADLLERLRALPDVEAAGSVSLRPLGGMGSATRVYADGLPRPEPAEAPVVDIRVADSAYFRTVRIPLRAGRVFGAEERAGAPLGVIVNQTMSRIFWGAADPVGRRVTIALYDGLSAEVIGVVGDVHLVGARTPVRSTLYLAASQLPRPTMDVVVRTTSDLAAMAGTIRATVSSLDPGVPVYHAELLDDLVATTTASERFNGLVLAAFAVASLLLAAVGVYGVLAGDVARRRREIGIRLALGARPATVLGLVLRRGIGRAAIGVAIGIVGAVAAGRSIEALLYGVAPSDPRAFGIVAALLLGTAFAGVIVPAYRASRVAPTVAMREE